MADFKGQRLRFGRYAGEVVAKLGATQVPLPPGEFFYKLQQGKVDGGEMSTPAIDAALGFDKLGLPYYMPGWQQPSAVLDFLMRKDKWETLLADAAHPGRDGLPRQHRLDAEPLAASAGHWRWRSSGPRASSSSSGRPTS